LQIDDRFALAMSYAFSQLLPVALALRKARPQPGQSIPLVTDGVMEAWYHPSIA